MIRTGSHAFPVFASLVVVLGFVLVNSAQADRRGYGEREDEPDTRSGLAMVSSVDVAGRRLVIDEVTYRVDDRTSIRRESGQAATLASIRAPVPAPGQLIAVNEVDFIRFEAVEKSGTWMMRVITILEEPVQ